MNRSAKIHHFMHRHRHLHAWLLCAFALLAPQAKSATPPSDDLVAWWSFDKQTATDQAGKVEDQVHGSHKFMAQGVRGDCLRFDGFTTLVQREAKQSPRLSGAMTFSAWVAMGAYPWNWTPILSQQKDRKSGFDFGLDHKRRFGLQLAVGDEWVKCISTDPLEMRQWYHLAATYDPKSGITLYLDGKEAGRTEVQGPVRFAPDIDLHMGRNHHKMLPVDRVREWAKFPSWWAHDGMLDEVKIHKRALSANEIHAIYLSDKTYQAPNIPPRKFPNVSGGLKRFGAYATNLKYYEQWDSLWQMAGDPDVVVKFADSPVSMVFWKGTHFSPCWVTENGKWMADQSLETGAWPEAFKKKGYQGAVGCSEHMSDTECRFTFARIVENTDARVVVHWRYAMVDCNLKFVHYDEVAGKGQWGDEFYYIYPDAVAARHVVAWWPERNEEAHQETIFLSEPGTTPEDNCELDAITLVGWEGQSNTYSWAKGFPKFDTPNPVIQMVNLKAKHKPYMVMGLDSKIWSFRGEVRKDYSRFPWWNHWPVARAHSDGRFAEAADRASHSSLAQCGSSNGLFLYGMTDQPAESKLALAKSWNSPPQLEVSSAGDTSMGYDPKERAYELKRSAQGDALKMKLAGSTDSPVHNPALVIENWGEHQAQLRLNGKTISWNKDARCGHRYRPDRCDLIVWLRLDSTKETHIEIVPTPPEP